MTKSGATWAKKPAARVHPPKGDEPQGVVAHSGDGMSLDEFSAEDWI